MYDLAKQRLRTKYHVYDHYLGDNAHPEDDAGEESKVIDEEESMGMSDDERDEENLSKNRDDLTLGEGEEENNVKQKEKMAFLK